jgi:UDP-N-acetylmuramoylalanine-D-glutamate ligase
MIAVTAFAGKKVAVFGLGGSGLVSASALLAGGADVIGWDDSVDAVAKATSAGIPTADLRQVDWSRISALVLAPGVPLTHPAPHWTVALARAAAVEVIGDIELFCRERRARRSSPSPAPTANRRPRRWLRISCARPVATHRSAAISAPRSSRWRRRMALACT